MADHCARLWLAPATNADAFELLHRDVATAGDWFTRRGVAVDVESVHAKLLALAWHG